LEKAEKIDAALAPDSRVVTTAITCCSYFLERV